MNTIGGQIQSQYLLKIKKILDKDNLPEFQYILCCGST